MGRPVARAMALAALLAPAPSWAQPAVRLQAPAGEAVVDGVMASLELEGDGVPRFVLASEYELLLRTELVVRNAPDALRTQVHVSVAQPYFELLMGEQLLQREAERAGEDRPDPARLAEARAWLLGRLHPGVAGLLAATGATRAELEALLVRRVVAEQYLVAHHARMIEPTEAEIRQAYQEERYGAYRAENTPLGIARAEIRGELVRASYLRAVRLYLRSLGSGLVLRVFARPGGEEAVDVP